MKLSAFMARIIYLIFARMEKSHNRSQTAFSNHKIRIRIEHLNNVIAQKWFLFT